MRNCKDSKGNINNDKMTGWQIKRGKRNGKKIIIRCKNATKFTSEKMRDKSSLNWVKFQLEKTWDRFSFFVEFCGILVLNLPEPLIYFFHSVLLPPLFSLPNTIRVQNLLDIQIFLNKIKKKQIRKLQK